MIRWSRIYFGSSALLTSGISNLKLTLWIRRPRFTSDDLTLDIFFGRFDDCGLLRMIQRSRIYFVSLGFENFKSQTETLEVISPELMICCHVSLLDLTVEIYFGSPALRASGISNLKLKNLEVIFFRSVTSVRMCSFYHRQYHYCHPTIGRSHPPSTLTLTENHSGSKP
jgi:hypothetical protein